MRTEMVIRMEGASEKGHAKAMKVAAAMQGVESVTLSGKDKSLLRVVGDGVDCNHLTTRLRRKVGHADVVELRTLHGAAAGSYGYGSRTGSFSRDATAGAYGNNGSRGGGGGGSSHYGYGYAYPTATATPDYHYYGQQQHQLQPSFQYNSYPPPYAAAHYEYYYPAAADPNGCSIM